MTTQGYKCLWKWIVNFTVKSLMNLEPIWTDSGAIALVHMDESRPYAITSDNLLNSINIPTMFHENRIVTFPARAP